MTKIKQKPPVTISNNVFYGLRWNKKAIVSVDLVARALLNMTELFKAQNITIGPMIQVVKSHEEEEEEKRMMP